MRRVLWVSMTSILLLAGCGSDDADRDNVDSCVPESDDAFCRRLKKDCGSVKATDNCGTARRAANCGTCVLPVTCGAANVCSGGGVTGTGGGSDRGGSGGSGGNGGSSTGGRGGGSGGISGGSTGGISGGSGSSGSSGCPVTPPPSSSSAFFVNVGEDCYWCNQPTFVDLVKSSECFRTGWTECSGEKSSFATDSDGWPLETPSGEVARTVLGPVIRTGTYVVSWKGQGTFSVRSMASGTLSANLTVHSTGAGTKTFVAAKKGTATLEIEKTDPADHLRDISIIPQDLLSQASCDPFYPELIEYLKDFAGLRMMDWTLTNDSEQVSWSDHIPPAAYRTANRFETALQLCNRLHRHCWLNVPHKANDDYVMQLATLVRDTLDPEIKAYIEYSNETWNSMFHQSQYCIDQGKAAGLPGTTIYDQGFRYHAYRAKQIFEIFDSVFGSEARTRLVRVIAGQTGNTNMLGKHIDQIGGSANFDAYSTAPYIGPDSVDGFDGQADNWNLDQLFDHLTSSSLPDAIADMNSVAQALAGYRPPPIYIAYEGGQHLAGFNASEAAQALYVAAQTDERMYSMYQTYFDGWKRSGGQYFAYYNALGPIGGRYGSWGLKPELSTPDEQCPKYRGLKAWDAANPKWW